MIDEIPALAESRPNEICIISNVQWVLTKTTHAELLIIFGVNS